MSDLKVFLSGGFLIILIGSMITIAYGWPLFFFIDEINDSKPYRLALIFYFLFISGGFLSLFTEKVATNER